jgi:hypothetical protein
MYDLIAGNACKLNLGVCNWRPKPSPWLAVRWACNGFPCRYSARRSKLLFEYSVLLQTILGHVSLEKLIGKTISAFLARTFKGVAFMIRGP